MANHKLKIWLSLTTAVLSSSTALASDAGYRAQQNIIQDTAPGNTLTAHDVYQPLLAPQLADTGGEGGEAGHDANITDPAVFMTDLARLEARLRSGLTQYELGRKERAASHFDQIVNMLNGDVGTALQQQGLDREHVTVEAEALPMSARDGDPMEDLMDYAGHLLFELDEHALLVPAELRRHPDFRISVVKSLLNEARDWYQVVASPDESNENKTFAYETARGLVWTSRDLIGESASELRDRSPENLDRLLAAYGVLQQHLSPVSLGSTLLDQSIVMSAFSSVEFALSPLHKQLDLSHYAIQQKAGGEGGEGGEGG